MLAEVGDLSHEEIAAVIEVPTTKVKALVHQARARLIADRDARETPCEDVRELLATARGGELRRGPLRRHLALCEPCSAYRDAVAEQRSKLALVLPVAPSVGLKDTILGALGGGGGGAVATAAGGGAAGGAALSGGATTAGFAQTLGAKLAIGAALAGGAGGGAVAVQRTVTSPERPVAATVARPGDTVSVAAVTTPGGAHGTTADAVLAGSGPDRASETGREHRRAAAKRRAAAAERRARRARERRAGKQRRAQARRQAKLDRAADKGARVAGRDQRKQDRVAAKQQRTAARRQRAAATPERGSSGSAPSAKPPKSAPYTAPRSQSRGGATKPPKALPAPQPVVEPVVTPGQGKSDAAKGRDVETLVP